MANHCIVHIEWLRANGFEYSPDQKAWTRPDGGYVPDRYLAQLPESSRITPRRRAMRKNPHVGNK